MCVRLPVLVSCVINWLLTPPGSHAHRRCALTRSSRARQAKARSPSVSWRCPSPSLTSLGAWPSSRAAAGGSDASVVWRWHDKAVRCAPARTSTGVLGVCHVAETAAAAALSVPLLSSGSGGGQDHGTGTHTAGHHLHGGEGGGGAWGAHLKTTARRRRGLPHLSPCHDVLYLSNAGACVGVQGGHA